jgi:hypothetical protein
MLLTMLVRLAIAGTCLVANDWCRKRGSCGQVTSLESASPALCLQQARERHEACGSKAFEPAAALWTPYEAISSDILRLVNSDGFVTSVFPATPACFLSSQSCRRRGKSELVERVEVTEQQACLAMSAQHHRDCNSGLLETSVATFCSSAFACESSYFPSSRSETAACSRHPCPSSSSLHQIVALGHFNHANHAEILGRFVDAEHHFRLATSSYPPFAWAWSRLGVVQMKMSGSTSAGQVRLGRAPSEAALASFERAAALDPLLGDPARVQVRAPFKARA